MKSNNDELLQQIYRRKRVNRIKKIIIFLLFTGIIVPTIIATAFGIHSHNLEKENVMLQQKQNSLAEELVSYKKQIEKLQKELGENLISENAIQDVIPTNGKKKVYLTFDDGPSDHSIEILDILDEYQMKATFFVVGAGVLDRNQYVYKEIVDRGHAIGVHSYSHVYQQIYQNDDAFLSDYNMMSDLIYDKTGYRTNICRLPGGSSNTVSEIDIKNLIISLNKLGVKCYDWNISCGDADGHTFKAEEIAQNVIQGIDKFQTSIVLLHDGKDKRITVEALKLIAEYYSNNNEIEFLSISEDTPVILHMKI